MFFFDDLRNWEPYSYRTAYEKELDEQLICSVNFVDCGLTIPEQQLLLKLWILAIFFGNVQPTKIILLLLGEQGSGKTSALRRIQKLIFGSRVNLLSVEKDNQDGFIATVTTDPVALFDNLDEQISWLPYNLSRLATGVTFSRRKLYTTNERVEFPAVSWLDITARSVDFMKNQPDLPDRTLVLRLARLIERLPEENLLSTIAAKRNAIWSELLDELNGIVRHLKEHPEPVPVTFRMADFASFAIKVATLWGRREEAEQAFAKLEGAQAELVLDRQPLVEILGIWLETPSNQGREVDAGALYAEFSKLATARQIPWSISGPKGLGLALSQLQGTLHERYGMTLRRDGHSKQNRYAFQPRNRAPDLGQPTPTGNMTDEVIPELAGCAGCLGDKP